MATQAQYAAATAAVQKDVDAEIAADVPVLFRDDVPTAKVAAFVLKAAKDAVDAAEAAATPSD